MEGRLKTYHRIQAEYTHLLRKTKKSKWQDFTSASKTVPLQAKLMTMIHHEPRKMIGALRDGDGYTDNEDDSLAILLKEHFPEHTDYGGEEERGGTTIYQEVPWITDALLSKAIHKFQKGKRAGPDGIRPEMLKHLPEEALLHLRHLYQMVIATGHTPWCWKEAQVIFLPKPNKADYTDPRSFRPITLSSFVLKTLERLVLWHLEETTLAVAPLSDAQTGFRKGYSTDLAITRLTNFLEQAKQDKAVVVSLFMDIKGAFDNVPYRELIAILRNKGTTPLVVNWYDRLLRTRLTFAAGEKTGNKRIIQHTRGVPQGGILSPIMWNIFFDPLLERLQSPANRVIGYADDLCVLEVHSSPFEASLRAQDDLQVMEDWSCQNKMEFCPKKSETLVFNWGKRRLADLPGLTLGDTPVTRTTSVTYLGLQINTTHNWWPHIQGKIKKAKHLLRRSNTAFGRLWGPKPTMIKWSLDAIITPKILYGRHVWHRQLQTQKVQEALHQVNRLGMISIAPSRLRTPTRGMEMILGSTPMHITAERKNIMTLARFRLHYPDMPVLGHTKDVLDSMATTGLAHIPLDDIPLQVVPMMFRTYIGTELPSRLEVQWIKVATSDEVMEDAPVVSIYTDGSKIEDQKGSKWGTGAGIAIFVGTDDIPIAECPPDITGTN